MYHMRWRLGESRRGPTRPALPLGHPGTTETCLICHHEIGEASTTQLIAVGATTAEDRQRMYAGAWISAGAVLVHAHCASMVTDDRLDLWARQLHRHTGKR